MNASRGECINMKRTFWMHQNASECIRMHHVKNAADHEMHQNATASHWNFGRMKGLNA